MLYFSYFAIKNPKKCIGDKFSQPSVERLSNTFALVDGEPGKDEGAKDVRGRSCNRVELGVRLLDDQIVLDEVSIIALGKGKCRESRVEDDGSLHMAEARMLGVEVWQPTRC